MALWSGHPLVPRSSRSFAHPCLVLSCQGIIVALGRLCVRPTFLPACQQWLISMSSFCVPFLWCKVFLWDSFCAGLSSACLSSMAAYFWVECAGWGSHALVCWCWANGQLESLELGPRNMGVELREGLESWECVVHLLPDIQHNLTVAGLSLLGVVGMQGSSTTGFSHQQRRWRISEWNSTSSWPLGLEEGRLGRPGKFLLHSASQLAKMDCW